jgi:hypothetical protein
VAVNFLDIGNMARHDSPDQGHAAAGFGFGRKGDDGDRGAMAGKPGAAPALAQLSLVPVSALIGSLLRHLGKIHA